MLSRYSISSPSFNQLHGARTSPHHRLFTRNFFLSHRLQNITMMDTMQRILLSLSFLFLPNLACGLPQPIIAREAPLYPFSNTTSLTVPPPILNIPKEPSTIIFGVFTTVIGFGSFVVSVGALIVAVKKRKIRRAADLNQPQPYSRGSQGWQDDIEMQEFLSDDEQHSFIATEQTAIELQGDSCTDQPMDYEE